MSDSKGVVIIGGGIAGTSAALTCVNRGEKVTVIANPIESSSLYKAEKLTNYPGLAGLSGRELGEILRRQLENSGAKLVQGRALNVMDLGGSFGVAVGNDFLEASAVILALGITRERLYPGEAEFLGRGVSYCATCDGMLYKGKTVALIGNNREAFDDAEFLEKIGCRVLHFRENLRYEIRGGAKADMLVAGDGEYPVDGVFIIKDSISVSRLLDGLKYENGAIVTERDMSTSVRGVFACGDCAGKPYQLAQAAGEGNIAALSACEYIKKNLLK